MQPSWNGSDCVSNTHGRCSVRSKRNWNRQQLKNQQDTLQPHVAQSAHVVG